MIAIFRNNLTIGLLFLSEGTQRDCWPVATLLGLFFWLFRKSIPDRYVFSFGWPVKQWGEMVKARKIIAFFVIWFFFQFCIASNILRIQLKHSWKNCLFQNLFLWFWLLPLVVDTQKVKLMDFSVKTQTNKMKLM